MAEITDTDTRRPHVVVAGAGPVGLFLTHCLARQGIRVSTFERGPAVNTSPRAIAYLPVTLREFAESDVLEDIAAISIRNAQVDWRVDLKVAATIKFDVAKDAIRYPFAYNAGQDQIGNAILQRIKRDVAAGKIEAEVLFGHDVQSFEDTGDKVVVRYSANGETKAMKCDYLVGCDGGRSSVRKHLGVKYEGFTWPKEYFMAVNVDFDFQRHGWGLANFCISKDNWAIIANITGTVWRVCYGEKMGQTEEEILAKVHDRLTRLLPNGGTDPETGENYKIVRMNVYRPHQRCASTMRAGRVLLAGDAAHSNNPIGGLGLTTGLLDAGPLARALGAVLNRGAPDSLLDTWARLRREVFLTQINHMSIENKRLVQHGGWYADDDRWEFDPDAKVRDTDLLKAMASERGKEAGIAAMTAQKYMAMPADWMTEWEDDALVKDRQASGLCPATLVDAEKKAQNSEQGTSSWSLPGKKVSNATVTADE